MANRPYKNVKRFADGVSKDVKKVMEKEKAEAKKQEDKNKDNQ